MNAKASMITRYDDEAARCSRCGFCQSACPTYRFFGQSEAGLARGRNQMVRLVIEGRAGLDGASMATLDECLRCGACVTACFATVRTDRLVAAARTHHQESLPWATGRPMALFMRHVLPRLDWLRRGVRLLRLAQRLGLMRLAKGLGFLPGPFKLAARGAALLPEVPAKGFHERHAPGSVFAPLGAARRFTAVYYAGCRTELLYPHLGEATVEVLRRLGGEVKLLPEPSSCCGLPAFSYGFSGSARSLALQTLKALDAVEADLIVTEIGSCYHYLKEYAHLWENDEVLAPLIGRVIPKVTYLSEVVARYGLDAGVSLGAWNRTITWQDSCQLTHLQNLNQSPRRILKSVAGSGYREMEDAADCCGGAGAYTATHPAQSDQVLARKLERVAATGAQDVVVGCQSCYMQMKFGVERSKAGTRVLHLAELLQMAMAGQAGQPGGGNGGFGV